MALEEKRALDEILIRVNSKTAPNDTDGVALRYRIWIEKDGAEMLGTSKMDVPVASDWHDPAVVARLGELAPELQLRVNRLEEEVGAKNRKIADLEAQITELQALSKK